MKWLCTSLVGGIFFGFLCSPGFATPLDACPLTASGALPAIICFDDLTDGSPTVTTNIPGATIGAGPDSASVTGLVPLVDGLPLPRAWVVLETGVDFNPPNSDVATLFGAGGPITVLFQSDTFATVPVFAPIQGSVSEDGGFQLLAFDTNLEVFVRSDLGTPEGVPEPASLAVLAVGLVGLGFARRRKV